MYNLQSPATKHDTTRLLVWLISLILLITGCDLSTAKTSEQYLAEARLLHDKKQNRGAIIQLKNSLNENSQNVEARILLGKIYTRLGEAANAEKELTRALDLEAPLETFAFDLGYALLMQGNTSSIDKIFGLNEEDSNELQAIKAVILGESALQERDFDSAAYYFDIAYSENSTQSKALLGQTMQALLEMQLEEAELLMQRLLASDAENPRVWLVQADISRANNNTEQAINAFKKTIQYSQPDDFFFQVAVREMAHQQLRANNPEEAKKSLELLKVSPGEVPFGDDSKLVHTLAVVAFQDKKYEQAYALAGKILVIDNMHPGALLLSGTTAAIQGNYQQAESHLKRFLALIPDHRRARKILAFVQAKNQRQLDALDTITHLVDNPEKPDQEALILAGIHSLETGDLQASSILLQKAVTKIPDDSRLRFALAENLALQKDFAGAIDQLRKIQHGDSKTNALFATAELQVMEKKYSESLLTLEQITELEPDNPMPLAWKGVIFNLMNEPANAHEVLTKALALDSRFYPAFRTLAIMASRSGDITSAEQLYNQAIENNPNNVEVLHDYANFLINQQRLSDAEATLISAQSIATDSTRSIVSLARLYLSQSMPDKAVSLLVLEAVKEETHPAIYAELGNAQRLKGDLHGALNSYKKLADKKTDSPIPHYLVATVQLALKDFDGAEDSLSKSLSNDPFFTPALVAATQLELRKKDTAKAKETLKRLQNVDPDNKAVPLLNASIARAEGDFELAANIYQELYDEQPTNFVLHNLVNTLWRDSKQDRALSVLNKAVETNDKNTYALYLLGSAKQHSGDTSGAISAYQQVISLNSRHYEAYYQLATLLKNSEPEKALIYATNAYELQPGNSLLRKNLDEIQKLVNK